MMPPGFLFTLCAKITPSRRADWLLAMQEEMHALPSQVEKFTFALGCLYTLGGEAARTRKGLNLIGRTLCGGALLFMSIGGLIMTYSLHGQAHDTPFARLVSFLFVYYSLGAGLFLFSLHSVRLYAVIGIGFAFSLWLYCQWAAADFAGLSLKTLSALSAESMAILCGIFIAALFLNLIYNPDDEPALYA